MKLFESIDFYKLIQRNEYPCISIYLPTHIFGNDITEDPIRLKNLLNKCQNKLESEFSKKQVSMILKPGFEILSDSMFWNHQNQGLTIFTSPSFTECFHLSLMPEEKFYIGSYFYILPLIPMLIKSKDYYILILNQKHIKLFRANYNNVYEIELPNIPANIDEILKYDDVEEHIQMHTTPFGKTKGNDVNFHGQGNIADKVRHKKNIENFFKEVAKGIDKQISEQKIPMVLVGVEYEQAIYKRFSSYKYILNEGLSQNGINFDVKQIYQRTQEIVQPYFNKEVEDCLSTYKNLTNTGKVSDDIKEILPSALKGRVETLLLDIDTSISGTIDPETQEVKVQVNKENRVEDLMNLTAIQSLKNDAKVCPIMSKEIDSPLAAVYRF